MEEPENSRDAALKLQNHWSRWWAKAAFRRAYSDPVFNPWGQLSGAQANLQWVVGRTHVFNCFGY